MTVSQRDKILINSRPAGISAYAECLTAQATWSLDMELDRSAQMAVGAHEGHRRDWRILLGLQQGYLVGREMSAPLDTKALTSTTLVRN